MDAKKIRNPYYDEFLVARNDPDAISWDFQYGFTHKYAWAVPTPKALNTVAEFCPNGIVELGAGTGYWASLLRAMGVDVLAFDASPVQNNNNRHHRNAKPWTPIRRGFSTEAARHSDRVLMLSWPPKAPRPLSHRALAHYTGDKLVYVGQPKGGVTATPEFHDMLETDWELVLKMRLPNWKHIYNALYLYRRKTSVQSRQPESERR